MSQINDNFTLASGSGVFIRLDGSNDNFISDRINFPFGVGLDSGSSVLWNNDGTSQDSFIGPVYAGIPGFQFKAGRFSAGDGLNTVLLGGGASGAGLAGGSFIIVGGEPGAGGNYGYISVGYLGSPNRFTLANVNAQSSLYVYKDLEVDGTTWLDGALNVAGATALATSLTGILKATSGVVATASSSDILTAIGTIDISSNTNLAVTSPITLTGDTVGFNESVNFTWTGTHLFKDEVTIEDDVKFYIGDNSLAAGNVSVMMDASLTGSILVAPENSFGGYLQIDSGIVLNPQGDFISGDSGHTTLGIFGASLSSPIISPSGASDSLHVRKQSTGSGIRALSVQAEFVGSGTSFSSNINGFNSFAYDASGNLSPMTATGNGGGLRNRSVVRKRGTNAASIVTLMSGSSCGAIQDASTAVVTESRNLNIEAPNIGASATTTTWKGINVEAGTISGTATTAYQIFISELLHGTSRFELWLDGGSGLFLRESGNQISSPSSGVVQYDATTRHDLNNTVRMNALTASRLVGTDASKNLTSLSPSAAYSVSNRTTDRTYDCNSTTVDELADIIGTLILDLQTAGVLG